ncbi:hypothetical protein BG004_006109 [Podila humilis]|nr:hypothetical protein BG004_006109 [Podila humilis]
MPHAKSWMLEYSNLKNRGYSQIWDDLTKLGQEMKLALDSFLKFEAQKMTLALRYLLTYPEPLVEVYTMQIRAEATYVMHKCASAYFVPDAMNAFPLVRLLEVFEHAKLKAEKTVDELRRVKIHASPTPNVPLSWLRPSFNKPKLCEVVDC